MLGLYASRVSGTGRAPCVHTRSRHGGNLDTPRSVRIGWSACRPPLHRRRRSSRSSRTTCRSNSTTFHIPLGVCAAETVGAIEPTGSPLRGTRKVVWHATVGTYRLECVSSAPSPSATVVSVVENDVPIEQHDLPHSASSDEVRDLADRLRTQHLSRAIESARRRWRGGSDACLTTGPVPPDPAPD